MHKKVGWLSLIIQPMKTFCLDVDVVVAATDDDGWMKIERWMCVCVRFMCYSQVDWGYCYCWCWLVNSKLNHNTVKLPLVDQKIFKLSIINLKGQRETTTFLPLSIFSFYPFTGNCCWFVFSCLFHWWMMIIWCFSFSRLLFAFSSQFKLYHLKVNSWDKHNQVNRNNNQI